MEYCEDSLTRVIKRRGRLPESEAIDVLRQVLNGYEHMHALKIIHRDLKPDNILIKNGGPKIADFGLGRTVTFNLFIYYKIFYFFLLQYYFEHKKKRLKERCQSRKRCHVNAHLCMEALRFS